MLFIILFSLYLFVREKAEKVRNNLKIVVQLINPIYALYGFLKEIVI